MRATELKRTRACRGRGAAGPARRRREPMTSQSARRRP